MDWLAEAEAELAASRHALLPHDEYGHAMLLPQPPVRPSPAVAVRKASARIVAARQAQRDAEVRALSSEEVHAAEERASVLTMKNARLSHELSALVQRSAVQRSAVQRAQAKAAQMHARARQGVLRAVLTMMRAKRLSQGLVAWRDAAFMRGDHILSASRLHAKGPRGITAAALSGALRGAIGVAAALRDLRLSRTFAVWLRATHSLVAAHALAREMAAAAVRAERAHSAERARVLLAPLDADSAERKACSAELANARRELVQLEHELVDELRVMRARNSALAAHASSLLAERAAFLAPRQGQVFIPMPVAQSCDSTDSEVPLPVEVELRDAYASLHRTEQLITNTRGGYLAAIATLARARNGALQAVVGAIERHATGRALREWQRAVASAHARALSRAWGLTCGAMVLDRLAGLVLGRECVQRFFAAWRAAVSALGMQMGSKTLFQCQGAAAGSRAGDEALSRIQELTDVHSSSSSLVVLVP